MSDWEKRVGYMAITIDVQAGTPTEVHDCYIQDGKVIVVLKVPSEGGEDPRIVFRGPSAPYAGYGSEGTPR